MNTEDPEKKCPECGRFVKKLATLCPYCRAKTVEDPGKPLSQCKRCGKKIARQEERCPYCGENI